MKLNVLALAIAASLGSLSLTAAPLTYVGGLSGANEVPASGSLGSGYAVVVFDPAAHTLNVFVSFVGLTGNTTASHIHCCTAPGSNTGIATEVPSFSNLPLGVTSGNFVQTYNTILAATYNPAFVTANGGTAASAEAAFAAGLAGGNAYLNVHSSFKAGGELRANLVAAPEPGTLGLTGLALAGVALWRRKRLALSA
ncbi:MAG: CHRD domain-containing protein [Acidobacteriota bacterium]